MLEQESILGWIVIGGVAGWLAGLIVEGYGFGLLGNVALGIIGATLAGVGVYALGVEICSTLGNVVASTLGAISLLLIGDMIRRVTR